MRPMLCSTCSMNSPGSTTLLVPTQSKGLFMPLFPCARLLPKSRHSITCASAFKPAQPYSILPAQAAQPYVRPNPLPQGFFFPVIQTLLPQSQIKHPSIYSQKYTHFTPPARSNVKSASFNESLDPGASAVAPAICCCRAAATDPSTCRTTPLGPSSPSPTVAW